MDLVLDGYVLAALAALALLFLYAFPAQPFFKHDQWTGDLVGAYHRA